MEYLLCNVTSLEGYRELGQRLLVITIKLLCNSTTNRNESKCLSFGRGAVAHRGLEAEQPYLDYHQFQALF
jgi:hypothetical protein